MLWHYQVKRPNWLLDKKTNLLEVKPLIIEMGIIIPTAYPPHKLVKGPVASELTSSLFSLICSILLGLSTTPVMWCPRVITEPLAPRCGSPSLPRAVPLLDKLLCLMELWWPCGKRNELRGSLGGQEPVKDLGEILI